MENKGTCMLFIKSKCLEIVNGCLCVELCVIPNVKKCQQIKTETEWQLLLLKRCMLIHASVSVYWYIKNLGCPNYVYLNNTDYILSVQSVELFYTTGWFLRGILKRSRDCLLYTKKETNRVLFTQ